MTMTDTGVGFLDQDWQHSTTNVGGVLGAIYRARFKRNATKQVETTLDVDPVTARNLIRGHASERTITKAIKAEGWPLIIALGEAMTGQSYADHLTALVQEHEHARERAAARQDHLQSLEERARRVVGLRAGAPSPPSRVRMAGEGCGPHGLGHGEA